MILINDNGWISNSYYRTKKAKEENKKSYFKNIYSIKFTTWGWIINGKKGYMQYCGYTVRQAIKKYNQYVKEA